MYTYLIIIAKLAGCYCYAEYDIFAGFGTSDVNQNTTENATISPTVLTSIISNLTTLIMPLNGTANNTNISKCLEEERPTNIGTYEVPTQKDIVLMMKTTLNKSFSQHYQQVLLLIKDMKQVLKESTVVEEKCEIHNKPLYKKCINQISTQIQFSIKNLMIELEHQKMDVSTITRENICNLSILKTDPLELIKTLAQENVSLQFTLPGFLRLISGCSYYCS